MFQTPTDSVQYSSMSSRRSTRTSRSGAAGAETQHSKKKKKSLRRPTPTGTGPARKWAKVLREPVENIGFKTIKWVPTEDLTFDEKIAWDEEEGRQKGSVINSNSNVNDGGKETETDNTVAKDNDVDASSNGDDADIDESDLNDSKHMNIDDEHEPPLKKVKIVLDEDETNQTLLSEQ
jgi:hypothetical protein